MSSVIRYLDDSVELRSAVLDDAFADWERKIEELGWASRATLMMEAVTIRMGTLCGCSKCCNLWEKYYYFY